MLKVKRHDVIITRPKENDLYDEEEATSCHHVTIEEALEAKVLEEDAKEASSSLEDGGQSTIDELKEVNLRTIEEPRPTFISAQLADDEEKKYVNLLTVYKDVFAWLYREMPGLDPKVVVHRLTIKPRY